MDDGEALDEQAFLDDLTRWAGNARADQEAEARSHQRHLRQMAEQEATFAGVVADLGDQGHEVVVASASGQTHHGRIVAVGRDYLVVRDTGRAPVFLSLAAISSIRLLPGRRAGDTTGTARPGAGSTLVAVLAGLAGDRPRVQIATRGDRQLLVGELRAVGTDVATLRLDGPAGPSTFVPLAAVTEVVLVDWP